MTAPLLIVNADDFGLTPGLSRAILDAGARGIVSSTSALANGKALLDAAPALRDSGLGVECLLDNESWSEGQKIVDQWNWPAGSYSVRLFLILVPGAPAESAQA